MLNLEITFVTRRNILAIADIHVIQRISISGRIESVKKDIGEREGGG